MNTLAQNSQLNSIYQSLNALNISELDDLLLQVIGARKQKMPHVLSEEETLLLKKINSPIPTTIQKRYQKLRKEKQANILSEEAHTELLQLTAYIEQHDNQRLSHIITLSQHRNEPLDETLNRLGLNKGINVV